MFDTRVRVLLQYSTHEVRTRVPTHIIVLEAQSLTAIPAASVRKQHFRAQRFAEQQRERAKARSVTVLAKTRVLVYQPRWKTVPVLELEPNEGRGGGATEENELVVPAVGRAGDAGKAVARLTRRTWPDASSCA